MANKRRLEVSSPIDEPQEDEQVENTRSDRDIAIEGTWGEWFQRVFIKYCYAIAILFLACVVPLEIVRQIDGSIGVIAAFISVLIIVPLGLFAYLKLWGDNGIWGPEYPEDD